MKTMRNPDNVHPPLAQYSHQIEITGPQRWLLLAGQVGMALDGTLSADPAEQLEMALENIQRNLEAAGMAVNDIVKLTIYLVENMDADKRREILSKWLGEHAPTMTLVYVAALATPAIKLEVEASACVDA